MINYKHIEELLIRLLDLLNTVFIESERKEVHDFIDVGEYGLALETLVDIVDEENKKVPGEVLLLVKELAIAMQIDYEALSKKLGRSVADD